MASDVHEYAYIALLYGRASVDPRKKGGSVTAQLRDCRPVCAEHGWPIRTEYRDDDRSASSYASRARDDYDKMLVTVRDRVGLGPGERYVIVAWEPSRISRNLESFFALRRACEDTATLLCLDEEIYDMRVPRQRQRLTELILKAETEADSIQSRNARTARQSVADGGIYGPVPYGYRREYDPTTGDLLRQVPDAVAGPVACEIIRRIAAHQPVDAIRRDLDSRSDLTEDGIKSPRGKGWSRATIRLIASNPAYIGMRTHHGEITGPGQWPALIDEATFWAAQAVLRDPKRLLHHGTTPKYLLTGQALCDQPRVATVGEGMGPATNTGLLCASQMYRGANRGRSYYYCRTCGGASIDLDMADDFVTGALLSWLEQPGRMEQIVKHYATVDTSELLAEVKRLETELIEARNLANALKLSPAGLAASEGGLLPALASARSALQAAVPVPELMRVVGPDARARWRKMDDMAARRAVVRAVMRVHVRSVGQGVKDPKWLPERVRIMWLLGT